MGEWGALSGAQLALQKLTCDRLGFGWAKANLSEGLRPVRQPMRFI